MYCRSDFWDLSEHSFLSLAERHSQPLISLFRFATVTKHSRHHHLYFISTSFPLLLHETSWNLQYQKRNPSFLEMKLNVHGGVSDSNFLGISFYTSTITQWYHRTRKETKESWVSHLRRDGDEDVLSCIPSLCSNLLLLCCSIQMPL